MHSKKYILLLIDIICQELDALYPDPGTFLNYNTPFQYLIAVILSAQCPDARVNATTAKLFKYAGTPQLLANMDLEQIKSIIKPCGFYNTKSLFIKQVAMILLTKWNSIVPNSLSSLIMLPGVGDKTAKVFLSEICDTHLFPVDRHIQRCLTRWHICNQEDTPKQISNLAMKLFPSRTHKTLPKKIILYGRNICTARTHHVSRCSLCKKTTDIISYY